MSDKSSAVTTTGFIGTVLAVIVSYATFKSVGYTFLAGIFGWFYLAYFVLEYGWPKL